MMDWLETAKKEIIAAQAVDLKPQEGQATVFMQLAQAAALIGILEELRRMNARAEAEAKRGKWIDVHD